MSYTEEQKEAIIVQLRNLLPPSKFQLSIYTETGEECLLLREALFSVGFEWCSGNTTPDKHTNPRENTIVYFKGIDGEYSNNIARSHCESFEQYKSSATVGGRDHAVPFSQIISIFNSSTTKDPVKPQKSLTIPKATKLGKDLRKQLNALNDTLQELREQGLVVEGDLSDLTEATISYTHPTVTL